MLASFYQRREGEVIGRTMRSKVHVGFSASGAIVTQLSRAKPAPIVDPPQIKTSSGSV